MVDEKDIDTLFSKVNNLSNRMTEIESTRPFLKEMIERSMASNEKLSETLRDVQTTMVSLNQKMDSQAEALETIKQDFTIANEKTNKRINTINEKVETIEDKGKFDIQVYIKQNWPWILVLIGLGVNFAVQIFKF